MLALIITMWVSGSIGLVFGGMLRAGKVSGLDAELRAARLENARMQTRIDALEGTPPLRMCLSS